MSSINIFVCLVKKSSACRGKEHRVARGCYQPPAPSEPCVRRSPHTAQASEKASSCGATRHAQHTHDCAILIDRHHPETGGRGTIASATSSAFLPEDGFSCVLANGHPSDVCSLSSRAKSEPVSAPLQRSIRVFRPLNPAPPSVCLTVHLPRDGAKIRGFHVPHKLSCESLRCALDAGGSTIPCEHVRNSQPDHTLFTQGKSL